MMDKLKGIFGSKRFMVFLGFLGLYFFSTGISWAVFSYVVDAPDLMNVNLGELASARSKIKQDVPKTEECPINGGMFTKIERDIWEKRRPLVAMVENHLDARPLSGVSKADVVYEGVAEGGITRLAGVFYCGISMEDVQIAPIRSARIHFVNLAAGYGEKPIFAHVGGANRLCGHCSGGVKPESQVAPSVDAIGELADLGWRIPRSNDFDTTYDSGFPVFWRNPDRLDHPVATEHTMMISSDKVFKEAIKRGLTDKYDGKAWDRNFESWSFADGKPLSGPKVSEISFDFWDNKPDYSVSWKYGKESNSYKRFNAGKAFVDLEYDNAQIEAKNVAIMFVKETGPVDKEHHMLYTTIGSGKAIIYQNGDEIEATWEKDTQESQVRFSDSKRKEIKLVRGTTWVELVPTGNKIETN